MAEWKQFNIKDIVEGIDNNDYFLPIIQRRLVWTEEKMTLLFDSLLKKNAFGGVMVLEQIRDLQPLFAMRNFLKDFTNDATLSSSRNQNAPLDRTAYFVIDGQQRMQTFYIGLKGSYEGRIMFFNLYSNGKEEFEFAFSDHDGKLPKFEKDDLGNEIEKLWYPVPTLYQKFSRDGLGLTAVSKDINKSRSITDPERIEFVQQNVEKFYLSIFQEDCIGLAIVTRDGDLDEIANRQKMVDLFQRLNNGGTVLSAYDLMASTLKGLDWRMEAFLDKAANYSDIGITQNELIKLVFILQDAPIRNLANIKPEDTEFALGNQERIFNTLFALRKFLSLARLENYFLNTRRSVIPLYMAAYHIFHRKNISIQALPNYFDNDVTGNPDFSNMKRWFYLSLLNGIFRGRMAGWVSEKTGLNKVHNLLKNYKDRKFPVAEIFSRIYLEHRLRFSEELSVPRLNAWDKDFLFYMIYDFEKSTRQVDVDHIQPKSFLAGKVPPERINCIENFQLIDISTNRGDKNDKTLEQWIDNVNYVPHKEEYIKRHLIPKREFWSLDQYDQFIAERGQSIIEKIKPTVPDAEIPTIDEIIPIPQEKLAKISPYQTKLEYAQINGIADEFAALHNVTKEIQLWATFWKNAIQYHHNISGTRVLMTIYIGNRGFWVKFYQDKFPQYYKISKDEIATLFGKWHGDFWLDVQKATEFIDRLGKLKAYLI